jgi:RNA polymerase sigma factor (sigma-70 family)
LREALGHLQLALAPPEGDGQLLARYLASRDEAAFAALVRRHGPLVLGVCRRLLGHEQDAEDAFQVTFLVLARKAGSVVKHEAVGSWLYGVACRTARKLRSMRARRHAREKRVKALPHPEVGPPEAQDWRPLLDAELSRLPEKYRAAVVLCDLEGQTHREVARQLGLATGTLASRLTAGRRLLAGRLSRRGVALSGGALALALAEGASAAVPAPVVGATARAAALVAAGQAAAVATPAVLLMNEVLRAMLMTKLKVFLAVTLAAVLLGAGGWAYQASGQAPVAPTNIKPSTPSAARPLTDVEVLQREMAILKAQMALLQDQVRGLMHPPAGVVRPAKEKAEGRWARGPVNSLDELPKRPAVGPNKPLDELPKRPEVGPEKVIRGRIPAGTEADPLQQAEAALQQLRTARDQAARQRAADALERAARRLRAQPDQNANRIGP